MLGARVASRNPMRNRERVKRILRALPAALRARLKAELPAAVAPIVREQKQRAPVYAGPARTGQRPGELRDSIKVTTGDRDPAALSKFNRRGGARDPELVVVISAGNPVEGTTRSDAHLQEWGTGHHDAQPFFFGPVRAHKERVLRRMRRILRAAIKDAVRLRTPSIGGTLID